MGPLIVNGMHFSNLSLVHLVKFISNAQITQLLAHGAKNDSATAEGESESIFVMQSRTNAK